MEVEDFQAEAIGLYESTEEGTGDGLIPSAAKDVTKMDEAVVTDTLRPDPLIGYFVILCEETMDYCYSSIKGTMSLVCIPAVYPTWKVAYASRILSHFLWYFRT